jgi:hypothetical protein
MAGSMYRVKYFTTGSKSSLKIVRKLQVMPDQVTLLGLRQKQLCSGWKKELIQAGRRIMIDSVVTALGCSHGFIYSIMYDHLKFWKVCAQWVPKEQKDREKINGVGLSL